MITPLLVLAASLFPSPLVEEKFEVSCQVPIGLTVESLWDESFANNGVVLVQNKETQKYGLLGVDQEEILEPEYRKIIPVTDGLFLAKPWGEKAPWTLYGRTGKVGLSGAESEDASGDGVIRKVGDGVFAFRLGEKAYQLVGATGEAIGPVYTSLKPFADSSATAILNNRLGVVGTDSKEILAFEYLSIGAPLDGVFVVKREDNLYGSFREDFTPVLPFEYPYLQQLNDGYCLVLNDKDEVAVIGPGGELAAPFGASSYTLNAGEYIGRFSSDGTRADIIDLKLNKVLFNGDSSIGAVGPLSGPFFLVQSSEDSASKTGSTYRKMGLIDVRKGLIASMDYYGVKAVETEEGKLFQLTLDFSGMRMDLMNEQGDFIARDVNVVKINEVAGKTLIHLKQAEREVVVGLDSNEIENGRMMIEAKYSEGLAFVRSSGLDEQGNVFSKRGYIDIAGEFVFEVPDATGGEEFQGGRAVVRMNSKDVRSNSGRGLIDTAGHFVVNPIYSSIRRSKQRDDLFIVKTHAGFFGVIDRDGVELYPAKAEALTFHGSDFVVAKAPGDKGAYQVIRLK